MFKIIIWKKEYNMKIYTILFDTVPQHPRIEEVFKSKNLHYSDFITNSCTVTTLVSLFSGKTPSEMRPTGIGHSHTYALSSEEEKKEWDKNIIFNNLPDDWNIHIHSMPETRGDNDTAVWPMYPNQDCRLLPDDICGRDREFKFYDYEKEDDERNFIKKMQNLPSDENHFIVLKYNHFHDRERGKHEDVISLFIDIINTIDFEEENSLFWIFADHGTFGGVDTMMSPPMSWLSWVSVVDNITNKKVTKDRIYVLDYYNTIMNRIYPKMILDKYRERSEDVLSKVDKNRIYVVEDGRSAVDEWNCTTVSSIEYKDENIFIQVVKHLGRDLYNIWYDRRHTPGEDKDWSCSTVNIKEIEQDSDSVKKLVNHLKSGVWKWYFGNE
tara:strand:- start:2927 stop:4072 length:1146 start_codon:yes stop_codon:yes gene_type:complete